MFHDCISFSLLIEINFDEHGFLISGGPIRYRFWILVFRPGKIISPCSRIWERASQWGLVTGWSCQLQSRLMRWCLALWAKSPCSIGIRQGWLEGLWLYASPIHGFIPWPSISPLSRWWQVIGGRGSTLSCYDLEVNISSLLWMNRPKGERPIMNIFMLNVRRKPLCDRCRIIRRRANSVLSFFCYFYSKILKFEKKSVYLRWL